MPKYTFDAKLFATVHVCAPDEKTARALLDDKAVALMDSGGKWSRDDQSVFINSVSQDGDADLLEIDGEPVP